MRLIHDSGYTDTEKLFLKEVLYDNIMDCITCVVHAMEKLGIDLVNSDLEHHRQLILATSYERGPEFPTDLSRFDIKC